MNIEAKSTVNVPLITANLIRLGAKPIVVGVFALTVASMIIIQVGITVTGVNSQFTIIIQHIPIKGKIHIDLLTNEHFLVYCPPGFELKNKLTFSPLMNGERLLQVFASCENATTRAKHCFSNTTCVNFQYNIAKDCNDIVDNCEDCKTYEVKSRTEPFTCVKNLEGIKFS